MENIDLAKYDLGSILQQWLIGHEVNSFLINILVFLTDAAVLLAVIVIIDFLTKKILLNFAHRIVLKTKANWDDYFFEQRVFVNLAHLAPAIAVQNILPFIFNDIHPSFHNFLNISINIYIVVIITIVLSKTLKALENLSERADVKINYQQFRTVAQVLRILVYVVAILVIISVLFKVHIGSLLGGMAGATAILILVFQDTIKGLLANFQINMYDLIKKGDWITFTKYGVDGDVVSIDLTTVKVKNWDKTISSVPAVAFVMDSFVNWRGMKETNARRIKRDILIDINSIAFADEKLLEKLKKVKLVEPYIIQTQKDINTFNVDENIDTEILVNGRHQTNLGIYRAYVYEYLKTHPQVNSNLTLMVRQLQPTAQGIPLEVYCFSASIVWEEYEAIQADIFDHLFAATKFFNLQLYQAPAGHDFEKIGVKG